MKKSIGLIIIFLAVLSGVHAQTFTPCFEPDVTRGCAPLTVNLTDCSGAPSDLIFYDFGDGPQAEGKFTFENPGVYTVTQIINSGAGGDRLERENLIEVLEARPFEAELLNCNNGGIRILISDDYYEAYEINFGDGTTETFEPGNDILHSYANESLKEVVITGIFEHAVNNCFSLSASFRPIAALEAAEITVFSMLNNTSARMEFSLTESVPYRTEQSVPGLEVRDTLNGSETETEVAFAGSGTQLFRITAFDYCSSETNPSPEVQTLRLTAESEDAEIRLLWNETLLASRFSGYRLFRDGERIYSGTNPLETEYLDEGVRCGREYCYSLEMWLDGDSVVCKSLTECVVAQSSKAPAAMENFQVSVSSFAPVLTWELPEETEIERVFVKVFSPDGEVLDTLRANVDADSLRLDALPAFEEQRCFSLIYEDNCGNLSEETELVCSILLDLSSESDESWTFDWTSYNGFDSAAYEIVVTDGETEHRLPADSALSFEALKDDFENQVLYVRVSATDENGEVFSNTVQIVRPAEAYFPNAFSPNDDGLNDDFGIVNPKFIVVYELRIFDRLGNMIFRTSDMEERWTAIQMPRGTYTYQMTAEDMRGFPVERTGTLQLVR